MTNNIPIIIPAYEPDNRMVELIRELKETFRGTIVVVNDGSGHQYDDYFNAVSRLGCMVLNHYTNLGKGRALKTAFNYCLDTFPNLIGCVTADSDGQHRPHDILKCIEMLDAHPEEMILGCREFGKDLPWKSLVGNRITVKVCKWVCGVSVSDTQTGLRAIPKGYMIELMNIPGERFEFETRMLIESKNKYEIREVPIETIYDSKENHQTHFDPLVDSLRIYRLFFGQLLRFALSSLSSCVVDLVLFMVFCPLFKPVFGLYYITVATVLARIISATYNYLLNYKVVFRSEKKHTSSAKRYFVLAVIQMSCSALFTTWFVTLFTSLPEVVIKIVVDTTLFIISYIIQRKMVF